MILLLVPAFLLLLVTLAAGLRLAELRWPRFSAWLDRHLGTEPGQDRAW